jgi:hypothetical protein
MTSAKSGQGRQDFSRASFEGKEAMELTEDPELTRRADEPATKREKVVVSTGTVVQRLVCISSAVVYILRRDDRVERCGRDERLSRQPCKNREVSLDSDISPT